MLQDASTCILHIRHPTTIIIISIIVRKSDYDDDCLSDAMYYVCNR